MPETSPRLSVLPTYGHLGIALLAFAPVAYRLRRAARPGQLVVAGIVILTAGQWANFSLLFEFVGTSLVALAPVILLATLGGTAVLGWPRERHDSIPVCALEAGALGAAAHLLGDVVAQAALSPTYPLMSVTYSDRPGAFGGEYDVTMVTATPNDVSIALLAFGLVAVVFALGHARIHGQIPPSSESSEPSVSDGSAASRRASVGEPPGPPGFQVDAGDGTFQRNFRIHRTSRSSPHSSKSKRPTGSSG